MAGSVSFDGGDVTAGRRVACPIGYRRQIQMIFQDPYSAASIRACGSTRSSPNPRATTGILSGEALQRRVDELVGPRGPRCRRRSQISA